MAGSTLGTIFRISTWGESHGKGIGVVIDGCPAGLPLEEKDIQEYLDRRKPGQSKFTTQRKEGDQVEILSGVFDGKTTGTPISLVVFNQDQRSRDYSEIASYYRPGHADCTFDAKYGFRDYRGGGRSSGRETIGRVAAGAVAIKILKQMGIQITAYSREIGGVSARPQHFSKAAIMENPLYMPDNEAAQEVAANLDRMMANRDSCGGIIECIISGMPAGIGETVFEKLDANLAKGMMSIGSVKGVEIGDGFAAARALGSVNNDAFIAGENGCLKKATNHAGGILGGMSDAADIIIRAAIKPTPSIAARQRTVNQDGEAIDISIKGRHDPIIVPRAVVVVEAMAALILIDMLFIGMTSRLDRIVDFYK